MATLLEVFAEALREDPDLPDPTIQMTSLARQIREAFAAEPELTQRAMELLENVRRHYLCNFESKTASGKEAAHSLTMARAFEDALMQLLTAVRRR